MEIARIAEAFEGLERVRVTVGAGRVAVHLPALDDTVNIDPARVLRYRHIRAPYGGPAVEFVMSGERQGVSPLIFTSDDVVYPPAPADAVLDSPIGFTITDAPPMVAYTEMERISEGVASECARPGLIELGGVSARLLLVRCFIVAATRLGLRPIRSVAWWQRAWDALGGDVLLPPFRDDPVWDALVQQASRIAVTPGSRSEDELEAPVELANFRALEPMLTAVRLDDEFVSCWRATIPISPAQFVRVLLDRIDAGRVAVALYPGGGGSVDLTLSAGVPRRYCSSADLIRMIFISMRFVSTTRWRMGGCFRR
ncbi:hypothetical protein KO481_22135 [Nocardia sp. NEAU-G5]|uniref:Uncharacterized protein n=1 Tax=Nocardia albiluteola TaxID=2842303 RepID=A0ABS6B1N4_9NOCA|nr:hypothetical protein [Nocardia albiluteola]MBU3064220.1 hypothetical protein [Nocardia albiluteola]